MIIKFITKRDGKVVRFDQNKIKEAIIKAMVHVGESVTLQPIQLTEIVCEKLQAENKETVDIEHIQDTVERTLMENGYPETAKAYILYREERNRVRQRNSDLMKRVGDLYNQDSKDNNELRENANVDGSAPMGTMLKIGSAIANTYADLVLPPEISKAHRDGDIHIHDRDFYFTGTTTCTQIDLTKLFKNGFSTGHGFLREPQSIMSYASLAAIAIQANQNDQHGGQSIPNFDRMMADGVKKTYEKKVISNVTYLLQLAEPQITKEYVKELFSRIEISMTSNEWYGIVKDELVRLLDVYRPDKDYQTRVRLFDYIENSISLVSKKSLEETDRETYQAMEAFIHNLNTMHSRAGAQVPFSSVNYGTDTSAEARMVVKNILLATDAGLGNGETPIFPIQIFRCKHGVNMAKGEPNYDLFKLACKVSAKRLFPNFSFQDAPFNLQYYKEGHPETEIAYMGCRTRVMANVNGPEISYSRGNLSFTSINLPRIAIESKGDWNAFYTHLDSMLELVKDQLLERYKCQCAKRGVNFPFLMQNGVWLDAEKLKVDDSLDEILKNGTLTIGFIGLAECLVSMMGVHHGESKEAQEKGLEIVRHMREFCDACTNETRLNFSLIATPAEGLSGRFVKIDAKKYGVIKGVTDRDYYTNSFHVPVYYPISAYDKIAIEAPYHALTNGGHISYIELDGDPGQNLEAFEKVVMAMDQAGIGYGAINHPVDRDPLCGFNGVIGDTCPCCGRKEFYDADGNRNGVGFDRIRRITGYLVGTLDRFNDGKRAEERDRVKHGI